MIDWNRIAELKDEIGEDDFAEVIGMFTEEVEAVIARLRRTHNSARLEADLHFMKSSALNLGFAQLAALCQSGEHRSAQGRGDSVDLVPIFACYEASKSAIRAA